MSDDTQNTEKPVPAPEATPEAGVGDRRGNTGRDNKKDETTASPSSRGEPAAAGMRVRRAVLNDEIEILPDAPLPQYDNGDIKAYRAQTAEGATKVQAPVFAYVCDNAMIPRGRLAGKMRGIINPSLANLVEAGVVYWPPAKAQRYVFVYEDSLGKPIMSSVNEEGLGWRQDAVMDAVIKPMVNVFLDLRDSGIYHGNIRPTNMYDGNAAKLERIILGDGLALPPGPSQPIVFEPVERGMCDPLARGVGTMADDLYSFGVTLTMILRTKDPQSGMSDEEILRQKIELGSYAALTGKERFTGGILELLRGLLYDDRSQRWTLDEIMLWLDGQRLSPKQNAQKRKASRPVHFNNERYFRPEMLAMDMDKMPSEAAQLVDGGGLTHWLTRSLEDKMTYSRYETAIESAQEQGRGPHYMDGLLSRVSIALDPYAPIRYKGKAINPDGLPYVFADAMARKGDISPYVEIISQQLVMFWLNAQIDVHVDIGGLVSKYENCRAFLKQTNAGYGVERILYYMLPDCPCYSEKLKGYYILNPEDMMYAFEEISHKKDRPALFLDRHIIAFLSVKDRKVVDGFFNDINSTQEHRKILGNIKCLATIQKRSKMDMFPGISSWAADMLAPVYKRYHDRHLRVKLKDKVENLRGGGDLIKIAGVIDNNNALHQDMLNFKQAMEEHKALREEQDELEHLLEDQGALGKQEGQEYAAVCSLALSVIVIVCFTFLFLTNGGKFF